MIAALFALSWLQSPKLTVIPDPSATKVSLVGIVKRSPGADEEEAHWRLLAEALPMGSIRYSAPALRQGQISTWCGPDHLGLRITVPKESFALGADMFADAVGQHLMPEDEVKRLLEEAPFRREDLWQHGLRGRAMWSKPLNYEAFRRFAARVIRPESLTVVVAGGIDPASAEEALSSRWDFSPAQNEKPPIYSGEKRAIPPTGLEYGLLDGPEQPSGKLSEMMGVAFALGVGKGAPAYAIWREKLGLSYRQEVFVEPSTKGYRLRAMLARSPKEGEPLGETMKSSLKTAIEAWTEADLERAKSMARLCLVNGILWSPLYLAPTEILSDGPESVATLGALTAAKTGRPVLKGMLLAEIEAMTLDELKQAALAFANECVAEVRFAK